MLNETGTGNIAHLMTPSPPIPVRALSLCMPDVLLYGKDPCKKLVLFLTTEAEYIALYSALWEVIAIINLLE